MKFFNGLKYACLPSAVMWAAIILIAWLLSSCSSSPFRSLVVTVQPGQTIQAAINAASAGDVVTVKAGTYNERVTVGKAVTLICETRQTCIIQGAVLSGNVTLDGFYSLNSATNSGAIVANGSGNKIINNKVEGSCMVGINLYGSANTAENNEILKSRQCAGSSGADADGIRYFGANQVMRGNYIHDISQTTNPTAHVDCFQTWGGASKAIIENNICDNYTANATLASSGANIENDTDATFRNNYWHIRGKMIMIESSSSGTKIDNNIFIGGANVTTPVQYGLFGSGSGEVARNNMFWQVFVSNGTPLLYGVTDGGGNLSGVDPLMSGYCSLAYPSRGVPCGVVIPPTSTVTPSPAPPSATPSFTPIPSTITPSITPSRTPTRTPTGTSTASFTPTLTPTPTQSRTVTAQPSSTPTPSVTPSSTPLPTATPVCFDDGIVLICYSLLRGN